MARTTPGSATSEFFICIGDQQQFDSSSGGNYDGLGYAAFGKVFKGMKVARQIQNKKSNGENFFNRVVEKIKNRYSFRIDQFFWFIAFIENESY